MPSASNTAEEHRARGPALATLRVAIVTASDSRTEATNDGGRLIRTLCDEAGLTVVAEALKAAEHLHEEGVEARVIDMHTVKPIDREAVIRAATETRHVFTLEEHSIDGGLGGAVAEVVAEMESAHAPLKRIGLRPEFNKTVGDQTYLKSLHGLDEESIVETIQRIITRSYDRVG